MGLREHKFRAWDEKAGKFFYSDEHSGEYFFKFRKNELRGCVLKETEPYFDEYPVEEFTGRSDKNGKEIYEDDIVHFVDPDNYGRPKVFRSIVQWFAEGCAWEYSEIKGNHSWGLHKFGEDRVEVIGNVHDDKET